MNESGTEGWIDKVKAIAKWVVLPLTLLAGGIFYLLQQISTLRSKLAQAQAEQKLAKTLSEIEEAKKNADQKENDYRNAVTKYREQHGDGGHES